MGGKERKKERGMEGREKEGSKRKKSVNLLTFPPQEHLFLHQNGCKHIGVEIGQHWYFLISTKKMKASTQSVYEWGNIMNNIVLMSLFEVRPSKNQNTQEYLQHQGQINLKGNKRHRYWGQLAVYTTPVLNNNK